MPKDTKLAVELQALIDDCRPDPTDLADPDKQVNAEVKLVMKLTSYIVRREHVAYNTGYQKGKARKHGT